MKFTEEQQLLRKTVRDFAEGEVRPRIDEIIENDGFVPRDIYERMGELGFIGMMCKPEDGGMGAGRTELAIVVEELSKVAPTLGLLLMCVAPSLPDYQHVPVFKERYMADVMAGRKVFDGAVTDPAGHTNQPEWPVMAKRVEGGYVLNGTKLFVSSAAGVDVQEVYAMCEDRVVRKMIVEDGAPGFNHDAHEVKFGMKGSGGGTCLYKDVFVPDELVIDGSIGAGDGAAEGYNTIWVACAAIALGAMEGAFEQATSYAKTRTFDFKPVASIQAQAQRIERMHGQVLACNALLYDCAQDYDLAGDIQSAHLKAQAAKVFISETAFEVTRACMKLHGGLGYSDVHVYHYFTDAVAASIMDLTNEFVLEGMALETGLTTAEELY